VWLSKDASGQWKLLLNKFQTPSHQYNVPHSHTGKTCKLRETFVTKGNETVQTGWHGLYTNITKDLVIPGNPKYITDKLDLKAGQKGESKLSYI
jgi:hypothetical protein